MSKQLRKRVETHALNNVIEKFVISLHSLNCEVLKCILISSNKYTDILLSTVNIIDTLPKLFSKLDIFSSKILNSNIVLSGLDIDTDNTIYLLESFTHGKCMHGYNVSLYVENKLCINIRILEGDINTNEITKMSKNGIFYMNTIGKKMLKSLTSNNVKVETDIIFKVFGKSHLYEK